MSFTEVSRPTENRTCSRPNLKIPSILIMLLFLACLVLIAAVPSETRYTLLPTLATIAVFLVFSMILKWRVGNNLFGELGFLYLGLATAYTVLPGIAFVFAQLLNQDDSMALALMLPASSELGIHLWRHVLFVAAVATGYLTLRGRKGPDQISIKDHDGKNGHTIVFLVGMVIVCILALNLMSGPVESYYDHYTRYNHLPWSSRKFVSVFVRLKLGIYSVLIVFLFLDYKKYKLIIPIIITALCVHEMVYSFGSRIESLIILLGAACLYNFMVKPFTLKLGLAVCLALLMLFSVVELYRASGFSVSATQDVVSQEGFKPASEFGSVYFTSFHLYDERAKGALPPKEWPMLFNDFISLVTFGDFSRWNPMDWYTKNYYPDSVVAPLTLGPIADSAIWGGEFDLLMRGLLNGAFFAYLVRWFLFRKDKWWALIVYVYCFATCILALKYSIFYHLNPLVKTVLPTLLVVWLVRKLVQAKGKNAFLNLG